ncbi:ATP-dependent Clp protease adaptor ClpS [Sciscionella sediminilitoris]|uniref:ATP-dependent Clp protease adaptor ClpS n=1 Tax=Sciscionella sediminilitoris TaxID=1445613 RepID=UPI0004DF1885|nr:ATP-dependent Clp protease adaptor ClpS [Sciscionella sp. SE31]
MVRLSLISDDVNASEAVAYALHRVFGWSEGIAASYARRAHADGSVELGSYPERGEAEELAARLLVFGMLARITPEEASGA